MASGSADSTVVPPWSSAMTRSAVRMSHQAEAAGRGAMGVTEDPFSTNVEMMSGHFRVAREQDHVVRPRCGEQATRDAEAGPHLGLMRQCLVPCG
jgi:hypothetical protein